MGGSLSFILCQGIEPPPLRPQHRVQSQERAHAACRLRRNLRRQPSRAGASPAYLPNLLMTPHVSGWTDGMLAALAALIAENIRRVAMGETPPNLLIR